MKRFKSIFVLFFIFLSLSAQLRTGAEQMEKYLPLLQNKTIALVVNQTSVVQKTHLLDTLLSLQVQLARVFAPEHGFRGTSDAGAYINDSKDRKTGIPIVSIYGKNKKPSQEQLSGIDIVIFDIQDVGTRFYTYISTLHFVMEACAENSIPLIVLDRPNPNDFIDGPVLDTTYRSFIGMHPIPILHGCTVGEIAQMIAAEGWLNNKVKPKLTVIPVKGWKHGQPYSLPIKPSPNLPNDQAIKLYPSLCIFEGTDISVGRGTDFPFQVIGYPDAAYGDFEFTPIPIEGMDTNPLHKGKVCCGIDLRNSLPEVGFSLQYLLNYYAISGKKELFFSKANFFDKLAGSNTLREQISNGESEEAIRSSWQIALEKYKIMRKKYLLYQE